MLGIELPELPPPLAIATVQISSSEAQSNAVKYLIATVFGILQAGLIVCAGKLVQ